MKMCGRFSSCLVRQVNEAVRIDMCTAECLMNSKAEFHQAPLVRVVATTGLLEEQDEREVRGEARGRRATARGVRRDGTRGGRRNQGSQEGRGRARIISRGQ